jgi:enoyl-CoA hydratase/carnithine racemase
MHSLFDYKTIKTSLDSRTRSLYITLNQSEVFSTEMLFELESVLSWVTSKVEVHSIVINSEDQRFGPGLDKNQMTSLDKEDLIKTFTKIQKISYALFHLPQTVVMDLGEGAELLASELSIGADIRICNVSSKISFNHSYYGLVPSCGGMGFLNAIINPAMARNWLMTGTNIPQRQLLDSGFIYDMYDSTNNEDILTDILLSIRHQAPIQRIQTKLGMLESIKARLEHAIHFEKQISKAAMISEDWKTFSSKNDEFMKAKSMSYSVKLTIVENEDKKTTPLPDNVTPII